MFLVGVTLTGRAAGSDQPMGTALLSNTLGMGIQASLARESIAGRVDSRAVKAQRQSNPEERAGRAEAPRGVPPLLPPAAVSY